MQESLQVQGNWVWKSHSKWITARLLQDCCLHTFLIWATHADGVRGSHARSNWDHLVCSACRRLRGQLTAVTTSLWGAAGTDLFTLVTSVRTRGHGLKLNWGWLRLDIRNRFFTRKVAGRALEWLSWEVVTAPTYQRSRSWAMLSGRCDGWCSTAEGWNMDFNDPRGSLPT